MSLSEKMETIKALARLAMNNKSALPTEKNLAKSILKIIEVHDKAVKELKRKWRVKCRRMEIMSGEVVIFELEGILKQLFGEDLK